MTKRYWDSTRGTGVKVKKRKGMKVRTVNVPDSDDEDPTPKVETEYARLLKTRVATSGKAESVTRNSLPVFEVKAISHNNSLEPTVDSYEEVVVGNATPTTKAKKQRKRVNDSVHCVLFIE
jgi:hypothetical protein